MSVNKLVQKALNSSFLYADRLNENISIDMFIEYHEMR